MIDAGDVVGNGDDEDGGGDRGGCDGDNDFYAGGVDGGNDFAGEGGDNHGVRIALTTTKTTATVLIIHM